MATKVGHTALVVSDTDKTIEFYCNALGLTLSKDFGWCNAEQKTGVPGSQMRVTLLATDDGQEVLETFEFQDDIEQRKLGDKARHVDFWSPHFAIIVDDARVYYDRLVQAGAEVAIDYTETPMYRYAYFYDPDGYMVEIFDE